MKRMTGLLLGITLVASSSGCYCWWPWNGYGSGYGYGGGCTTGNCGMAPATMLPPQSSYYSSSDTIQAGVPTMAPAMAVQPVYPTTVATPLESLPTYR